LNACLGVGAVALLAKPVDPEALTALLAQVMGRSAPETPGRTGEAGPDIRQSSDNGGDMTRYADFKLLIVDDHAHNLFTLRTLIESHLDVTVLEASSGQEAIDLTHAHPDIDLIILDVQMPEMDGFQTASHLQDAQEARATSPSSSSRRRSSPRSSSSAATRSGPRITCSSPSTTTSSSTRSAPTSG
jgi:CheY-like chemotaxis protein